MNRLTLRTAVGVRVFAASPRLLRTAGTARWLHGSLTPGLAGTRRDTDVPRRAAAPRRGPASASRGPPHRQSPGLPPAQTETRQVQEHFKHGGAQAERPDRPPREKGTRETLPATASAGSKTRRVCNPNSHSTSWKTRAATTRPLSTWGFVDSWTTILQHMRVHT